MRKAYNQWFLNGHTNGLNYLLKIKENFETASWGVVYKNGKKVNEITIGDKALAMGNDYASQERLLLNLLHHEFGHSRFTDDRFELINSEIEKIYGTFELFNLFEDCRMEHKVRNLTSHRFNWFNYIKPAYMGVGHHHPESFLLSLKNAEALINQIDAGYAQEQYITAYCRAEFRNQESQKTQDEAEAEAIYKAERIRDYYYPATCEAKNSLILIPIIEEWLKEFYDMDELKRQQEIKKRLQEIAEAIAQMMAEDGVSRKGMSGSGASGNKDEDSDSKDSEKSGNTGVKEFDDLSKSKEISEDGEAAGIMDQGTEEVAGNAMTEKSRKIEGIGKKRIVEDHGTVTIDEHTNVNLLREDRRQYDRIEAARLQPLFEKFLKNQSMRVSTTRPSKRLSTRNIMTDRDKIYKRKEEITRGEKTISMVVDCSGSMGYIMPQMRVVIAIINNLAIKRKVMGNIILSAGDGYHSMKLPIADKDIDKITGFSWSEGLEKTFRANISLLKKSEYVFVLTDGDITDGEIDKKFLSSHNVKPIGLYIGEEAKNLSKWFDRSVNRENAKYTVDEMARKIK